MSHGLFAFCNRGQHWVPIAIYVIADISLASLSPCQLIKTEYEKVFVQISSKMLYRHLFFPLSICSFILFFCMHPGPDHGDDDRVLPLHLHHSGNVPCLLMQMESHSFSSPYRLRIWWIAPNCRWRLAPVHNINFLWQAGGIMEFSVCCIVNILFYTVCTTNTIF